MLALQDLPDLLDRQEQQEQQEQQERLVRLGRPALLAHPEPRAQLDLPDPLDLPAPQDRLLLLGHPMFGFAHRHTYPVAHLAQALIYMFLTAGLLLPM
jgi:hypothetical protein